MIGSRLEVMTMFTVNEIGKFVGQEGRYVKDGLVFNVKILDARVVYNTIQLLISPKHGEGKKWVLRQGVSFNA